MTFPAICETAMGRVFEGDSSPLDALLADVIRAGLKRLGVA